MNKTKLALLIFTLVLSLCTVSCTPRGADIFAFSECGATFTLIFPSENGDVTLSCTRDGVSYTAKIVSPERSRDITIVSDSGAVTVCAGEVKIPLSEAAAQHFSCIFDVMYRGDVGATVTRSGDGECTLISYDDGVLTLDENGIPTEIDVGRIVKIKDYLTVE